MLFVLLFFLYCEKGTWFLKQHSKQSFLYCPHLHNLEKHKTCFTSVVFSYCHITPSRYLHFRSVLKDFSLCLAYHMFTSILHNCLSGLWRQPQLSQGNRRGGNTQDKSLCLNIVCLYRTCYRKAQKSISYIMEK